MFDTSLTFTRESLVAIPKNTKYTLFEKRILNCYIPNLIQDLNFLRNKSLVDEPEFTSGKATQLEAKFDLGSNLIRYIQGTLQSGDLSTIRRIVKYRNPKDAVIKRALDSFQLLLIVFFLACIAPNANSSAKDLSYYSNYSQYEGAKFLEKKFSGIDPQFNSSKELNREIQTNHNYSNTNQDYQNRKILNLKNENNQKNSKNEEMRRSDNQNSKDYYGSEFSIPIPLKFNFAFASSIANGNLKIPEIREGVGYKNDSFSKKFLIRNVGMLSGEADMNVDNFFNLKLAVGSSVSMGSSSNSVKNFNAIYYSPEDYNSQKYGNLTQENRFRSLQNIDFILHRKFFDAIDLGIGYRSSNAIWSNKINFIYQDGNYDSGTDIFTSSDGITKSLSLVKNYEVNFRSPYIHAGLEKLFFKRAMSLELGTSYSNQLQLFEKYESFSFFYPNATNTRVVNKYKNGEFFSLSTKMKINRKNFSYGIGYCYDWFHVSSSSPVTQNYYEGISEANVYRRITMQTQQISLLFGYKFATTTYLE